MSEIVSNAPRFAAPAIPSDSPEAIDRSLRLPVTLAAVGAGKWMFLGLLILIIAALQRQQPYLFDEISWMSHGRLWAAGHLAVVYGFGLQAGLALMLWVNSRLNRNRFPFPIWAAIGLLLWNVGVLASVVGVLAGGSAGFTLMEMPRYAAPFLFLGFGLVAVLMFYHFHLRSVRETYPSQWYFLGALLWWPWSFSVAETLLVLNPVRGVVQASVHGWYLATLFGLFFVPVALGLIFYFVPKMIERPLHSRYLAAFAFWTLAFMAPWTGLVVYSEGPLPAWLKSFSASFNFLLVVPVAAAAWNYHLTVSGATKGVKNNPVLRLAGLGMVIYLLVYLLQLAVSFPAISQVVQLTQFSQASGYLVLFGAFGLVAVASLYYVVPRVWNVAWPYPRFVGLHLGAQLLGLVLLFLATAVGGVVQGFAQNDPSVPFPKILSVLSPFLTLHTLGFVVLFLGNVLALLNLGRLMVGTGWTYCKSSALWGGSGPLGQTGGRVVNHGPVLFFGILFSLALSWFGIVFGSHQQLGRQAPVVDEGTGRVYPLPQPGLAAQGEAVYRANNCAACHTQQVRQHPGDLQRGYGTRLSVARDFIYDGTVQLGHNRIGPDLANAGGRAPEQYAFAWQSAVSQGSTNNLSPEAIAEELQRVRRDQERELVQWHLLHLYNPRITSPESIMPGYSFLFKKQRRGYQPSRDALDLPEKFGVEPDFEVVPTDDAYALVAYLLNSRTEVPLFEAPILKPRLDRMATNDVPATAETNAPAAGGTNAAPAGDATNAPAGAQGKAQ